MPELHRIEDYTRLRQKDVAVLFNVTTKTVREWTTEGRCPRNQDTTYNLPNLIKWYANREAGSQALPELTPEERADPLFMAAWTSNTPAKERLIHFKAEREKLAFERESADLVPRDQVATLLNQLANRIREAGDILHRNFGAPAAKVLEDVLTNKEWKRYKDQTP